MPRSAFLEGAREAGGTKTYSGAIAKQKTAVPQGAASLSLAVLESDGRKGKYRYAGGVNWGGESGDKTTKQQNRNRKAGRRN